MIRSFTSEAGNWRERIFFAIQSNAVETHNNETPSNKTLRSMIVEVPSSSISDGLLNRIVESNTKLLNASLNPRNIHRMKRAIINKMNNAPIRLICVPNLAMTFSS